MAGEGAGEAGEEGEYKPPFCSSPACRTLSSAGLVGSGVYVFYAARNSLAGSRRRSHVGAAKVQFALSIGLIGWGLTLLVMPVRRWK